MVWHYAQKGIILCIVHAKLDEDIDGLVETEISSGEKRTRNPLLHTCPPASIYASACTYTQNTCT